MRIISRVVYLVLLFSVFGTFVCRGQDAKQSVKDSVNEMTIEIQKRNSLAIIPVIINGKIKVNLILDPYCQSVILFGKRYQRLLEKSKAPRARRPLAIRLRRHDEALSVSNSISIGPVMGENVPILVVRNADAMNFFMSVNGVIGTEFFRHFEVNINRRMETMTIRKSRGQNLGQNFVQNQYPFQ
jgi:hypothetical protein